ncbi:MAG: AAA family ATPase [Butyrivibrio sp.]|nr:AAA family ATPase [Butyrivibrio sp.]
MGMYVDPGNESFRSDVESDIYIDKTEMLSILNSNIGKSRRYFAVSRARRFGKSMVAGMIDAYYSIGCDSRELFCKFKIAESPDFERHLNKYHVLHFDMATFLNAARNGSNPVDLMNSTILKDFRKTYPQYVDEDVSTVPEAVQEVWENDRRQFVIIIDEWECVIRDAKTDHKLIMDYLSYLRGFFKTEESKKFLALGYITGILPIKKVDGESAMNNFTEYTMISPKQLAPYFGFTDEEVSAMCARDSVMDIDEIQRWYDGYLMEYNAPGRVKKLLHMYNPNSLVNAFIDGGCESYWKNTGAFGSLNDYIAMNMDGLKDCILRMLAGEECEVDTGSYQNDLTSFKRRDDVMTALIHMGYLGYNPENGKAFIPNEEVRDVFVSAINVGEWDDIVYALRNSDSVLEATWNKDAEAVASAIAKSHHIIRESTYGI